MVSTSTSTTIKVETEDGEDLIAKEDSRFRCDLCDLTFVTIGAKRNHSRTSHLDAKRFVCQICGKCFATKDYKHTHVRRTHWREGALHCPVRGCKRTCITQKQLDVHHQTHNSLEKRPTYSCSICPKTFICLATLKVHTKLHIGQGFKCNYEECGKMFGTPGELRRHSTSHSEDRGYFCDLCERTYKTKADLQRHTNNAHPTKDTRTFNCSICNKVFHDKCHKNRHEKTHLKQREKVHCPHCPKVYSWKDTLTSHIKREHEAGLKISYNCPSCPKVFPHNGHLLRHLRMVHGPGEDLVCIFCPKVSKSMEQLRTHLRIHLREQPFKCQDCGKTYATSSNLYGHRKIHHTQRSSFKCPHCPKEFLERHYLNQHINAHNNIYRHNCHLCDFGSLQKAHLQEHLWEVHSEEKPFKCDLCPFKSAYSRCLTKHFKHRHGDKMIKTKCYFCDRDIAQVWFNYHLALHSKEKHFKCKLCRRRFRTYEERTKHSKAAHREGVV